MFFELLREHRCYFKEITSNDVTKKSISKKTSHAIFNVTVYKNCNALNDKKPKQYYTTKTSKIIVI